MSRPGYPECSQGPVIYGLGHTSSSTHCDAVPSINALLCPDWAEMDEASATHLIRDTRSGMMMMMVMICELAAVSGRTRALVAVVQLYNSSRTP